MQNSIYCKFRASSLFWTAAWLVAFSFFAFCGHRAYLALSAVGEEAVVVTPTALPATSASHTTKSIEDIQAGDEVLAYDPDTEQFAWKLVQHALRRRTDHLRILTIESAAGQTQHIGTTDEHPFWVPGHGWRPAGKLNAGDALFLADGAAGRVVATERKSHPELIQVYNLTVDDYHSYFVASNDNSAGALVHNQCTEAMRRAAANAAARLRRQLGDSIGDAEIHHIATFYGNYGDEMRKLFARAGVSPEDYANNLMPLVGHRGRHIHEYHEHVMNAIKDAMNEAKNALTRRGVRDAAKFREEERKALDRTLAELRRKLEERPRMPQADGPLRNP